MKTIAEVPSSDENAPCIPDDTGGSVGRMMHWVLLLVVFGLSAAQAIPVAGQNFGPHMLTIFDDYLIDGMVGYRRIKVRVDRVGLTKAAPNDVVFDIVGRTDSSYYGGGSITVSREVTIPRGKSFVETELYVPELRDEWGQEEIFVDLDRDRVYDFNRDQEAAIFLQPLLRRSQTDIPNCPNFLFLHSQPLAASALNKKFAIVGQAANPAALNANTDEREGMALAQPPNVKSLIKLLGQQDTPGFQLLNPANSGGISSAVARAVENFKSIDSVASLNELIDLYDYLHAARFTDLPTRFAGLLSFDIAVIPYAEVANLVAVNPEQREALASWLACGGSIIVLDAPADRGAWNLLIDQLTALPNQGRLRPWNALDDSQAIASINRAMPEFTDPQNSKALAYLIRDLLQRESWQPRVVSESEALQADSCWFTNFQLGRIVVSRESSQGITADGWLRCLANVLAGGNKAVIAAKLGDEPLTFQADDNFRIPGVGEPPRLMFLILIVGYAVAVGPVTYWLLNRYRRLNLLTVVVPLISLGATLVLLVFTTIKDGFGLTSVVVSATCIDQRTGSVLTQTDAKNFAGWSLDPYQFDRRDTPLPGLIADGYADGGEIRQSDAGWTVTGRRLRPRVLHQITNLRADASDLKLEFSASPQDPTGKTWQVTNRLGTAVSAVRFVTDTGIYWAEQIAPEATVTARVMEGADGWNVDDIRSILPSENYGWGRRRSFPAQPYYYGYNEREERVYNSLAMRSIEAIKSRDVWLQQVWLQPGDYVALVDESPFAKQFQNQSGNTQQKHIIYGRW